MMGPLVVGADALAIGATNFTEASLNATAARAPFGSNAARFASNALPNYLPLTGGSITGSLGVNDTLAVNRSGRLNNKLMVLFDRDSNEPLSTATDFFGFGINTGALRYQVP